MSIPAAAKNGPTGGRAISSPGIIGMFRVHRGHAPAVAMTRHAGAVVHVLSPGRLRKEHPGSRQQAQTESAQGRPRCNAGFLPRTATHSRTPRIFSCSKGPCPAIVCIIPLRDIPRITTGPLHILASASNARLQRDNDKKLVPSDLAGKAGGVRQLARQSDLPQIGSRSSRPRTLRLAGASAVQNAR